MPLCEFCSAPLPRNSNICSYCNARNDIDIREEKKRVNLRPNEHRECPVCKEALFTVNIGKKVPLFIEHCESCHGLFFDNLELEELIQSRVKTSTNINYKKIQELNNNPRYVDIVTYRHCPVCKKIMNRINYAKKSGVIMDVCSEHGIWLDPGELTQILEYSHLANTVPKEPIAKKAKLNKKYRSVKETQDNNTNLIELFLDIFS